MLYAICLPSQQAVVTHSMNPKNFSRGFADILLRWI